MMQKHELISLVDKMCKELLIIIDEENGASIQQVSNYLTESAQIILNVKEDDIDNVGYAESLFHNAYKEIAKKSLSSYDNTNKSIKKLARMHEETLSKCIDEHIDLPSITSKFNDIQLQMNNEVNKANSVITKLTLQVKALEEKTNLDALTKVFNRRALSSYLNDACSNEKSSYNFHVLVLDIDDFKLINDTYGHVAGDKVLIFIANILRKTLREGDKIFRYGGEEFVIILNRVNDLQCKNTSNRLLAIIRENKLIYKGETLKVTMSIGATKFVQGDTPDALIARADSALYRAKRNGKNQLRTEVKDGV